MFIVVQNQDIESWVLIKLLLQNLKMRIMINYTASGINDDFLQNHDTLRGKMSPFDEIKNMIHGGEEILLNQRKLI